MGFLDRPQQLWWRKAIFQVHLWTGIVLCLYMLVIGDTGSILVFESELEHVAYSHLWRASTPLADRPAVDFPEVVSAVRNAYPDHQITAAYVPDQAGNNFEFFVHKGKSFRYAFIDANTGRIVGDMNPDRSWLIWIIDLHFRLLAAGLEKF